MQNLELKQSSKLTIGNKQFDTNVILAPMAGITDTCLRQIIRKFTNTAILVTEMISSEGLRANKRHLVAENEPIEQPLFFQICGHKPDLMADAARKLEKDAQVIDINMGCPVGKIVKNSDGARLMTDLKLASEIIERVKNAVSVPVTVKCRLGWDADNRNYLEFAKMAQGSGADTIVVHGRTRSQMYSGIADWEAIGEIKSILDIPVIANGDVDSVQQAIKCINATNCDGVAIGRGALGNPYLIYQIEHYFKTGVVLPDLSLKEKIDVALEHTRMEMAYRGELHGIRFMRKFFAWYIKGLRGACKARAELVKVETYEELTSLFDKICNYDNE